jgi:hypothetical protein
MAPRGRRAAREADRQQSLLGTARRPSRHRRHHRVRPSRHRGPHKAASAARGGGGRLPAAGRRRAGDAQPAHGPTHVLSAGERRAGDARRRDGAARSRSGRRIDRQARLAQAPLRRPGGPASAARRDVTGITARAAPMRARRKRPFPCASTEPPKRTVTVQHRVACPLREHGQRPSAAGADAPAPGAGGRRPSRTRLLTLPQAASAGRKRV